MMAFAADRRWAPNSQSRENVPAFRKTGSAAGELPQAPACDTQVPAIRRPNISVRNSASQQIIYAVAAPKKAFETIT
jgi:hypothetical protein